MPNTGFVEFLAALALHHYTRADRTRVARLLAYVDSHVGAL
jgi:hypothetical protein